MNAIVKQDPANIVPISDNAAMMAMIARAASDSTVDIEKMERLWAMKERMDARDAEIAFNAALSRVQQKMGRIGTDRTNSQTRSDYATYGKLDSVLRPIYTSEGFSLSFGTEPAADGMVGMVCFVSHSAGHTRTYRANVPSDGKGAKGGDVMTKTHAFGSGTSYGMRYLLKMIFNVAIGEEDDDGNSAGGAGGAGDFSAWHDAIDAAVDMAGLNALAVELKQASIPAASIRAIRARWSAKAKELQA